MVKFLISIAKLGSPALPGLSYPTCLDAFMENHNIYRHSNELTILSRSKQEKINYFCPIDFVKTFWV